MTDMDRRRRYEVVHPERAAEQERRYRLTSEKYHERHREEDARWRAAHPEAREAHREAQRAYAARNRDRTRARSRVRVAVKNGVLVRQPCRDCGSIEAQAHHHLGYAPEHALDVIWLCPPHHGKEHRLVA